MAVYEFLCLNCQKEFELMRPMSEAEKPASCPKCGSKAQKLISGFSSKTGDSMQPAGEPFSKRTVVGEVGLADADGEGRNTVQKLLLQQLEEVANKVRSLEREKSEAVARIRALEREVGELVNLITLAGEKVDELLKVGANDDVSQPQAVGAPAESRTLEQWGEFSAAPQKQLKRLLPRSFISD
jgi:putative FmdB family regulatory protein